MDSYSVEQDLVSKFLCRVGSKKRFWSCYMIELDIETQKNMCVCPWAVLVALFGVERLIVCEKLYRMSEKCRTTPRYHTTLRRPLTFLLESFSIDSAGRCLLALITYRDISLNFQESFPWLAGSTLH